MTTTLTVAIDWDNDGSFATGGDDISAYVKAANARLGITFEDARVADIGQCVLIVNNADGRFSPSNTGGALYGKLLPNRPVLIQATDGVDTWTVFSGHVRSIEPDAGLGSAKEARIVCEDALSTLHRATVSLTLQWDAAPEDVIQLVLNQVFGGVHATGTITFSDVPSENDTVTIGTSIFTFKASPSGSYQVDIGATAAESAQNLTDAINALTTQSAYVIGAGVSAALDGAEITVTALEPGTYANSTALATDGANIAVSDDTLAGGTDEPSGLLSLGTGKQEFTIAGDRWSEDRTRAINAIADCVYSEFGLFWIARDGTVTFKNREYEFTTPSATPALTVSGHHTEQAGSIDESRIKNRIVVSYEPRVTATSADVVAQANSTISVPGTSGTERWNKNQGYVGSSGGTNNPQAGDKIVRIPYRDTGTGEIIAATDLVVPEAGTDYTVNDFSDQSGYDYTYGGRIGVSLVMSGGGIEASFTNSATGTLYVFDFQVRGKAITAYDPVQEIREDTTSITAYGRREYTYTLPLESDSNFVESLATYLLSRYKSPVYVVDALGCGLVETNSVNVLSVDVGDTVTVSETQTGVSSAKYLVTGMMYEWSGDGSDVYTTFYTRPIGDVTYWILEDATYGVLGSTARPAI